MESSLSKQSQKTERYAYIANNGLRVTKRTSQAVSLAWPENENDIVTFTDSDVSCMDMETQLDSQGNWFEVQMRYGDDDSSKWTTTYKGYGLRCVVNDLNPDSLLFFRMRRNGDRKWGSEIIATTDPPPVSTDDLSRAVEINSEYLVTRILGNTPTPLLKRILGAHDKNGMTPLMVACNHANVTISKMLLSCGARVNDVSTGVSRTPLMFACIHGKFNLVQVLDQHGANWALKDKTGCNAMHHAINGGNLAVVRLAFARLGKDQVFEQDSCGWSPLMRAVILSDNIDIVKFLVGKGADVNVVDRTNSKSLLMAAILSRKLNFVKFLLDWGANPFYCNENGKNCYEISRGLGYREISRALRERMEILQPNAPLRRETSIVLPSKRSTRASLSKSMSKKGSTTSSTTPTPSTYAFPVRTMKSTNNNNNMTTTNQAGGLNDDITTIKSPPVEQELLELQANSSLTETEYIFRPGETKQF